MSPLTRLAWWWLRSRGWAVQVNAPDLVDGRGGWAPLHSVRYGITPVYRVGPQRVDRVTRRRWAALVAETEEDQ